MISADQARQNILTGDALKNEVDRIVMELVDRVNDAICTASKYKHSTLVQFPELVSSDHLRKNNQVDDGDGYDMTEVGGDENESERVNIILDRLRICIESFGYKVKVFDYSFGSDKYSIRFVPAVLVRWFEPEVK